MQSVTRRVPLKTVALPNEHGAWGFLGEPALLGLLLAPSWAGLLLIPAAMGALLAQHPLSLVLADWRRGKTYPRTRLASGFVLGYGLLAVAGLLASVSVAGGVDFLLPALLAAPLALVQLAFEARNRGRALVPELAGAAALAVLAAVLARAGGWSPAPALALWLMIATRNLSSILYVRARLRLEYGRPVQVPPVLAVQGLAFLVILVMVARGLLPLLTLAAFLVLLVRAMLGLSRFRRPTSAKRIGLRELGFGLTLVLLTVAGQLTGL